MSGQDETKTTNSIQQHDKRDHGKKQSKSFTIETFWCINNMTTVLVSNSMNNTGCQVINK